MRRLSRTDRMELMKFVCSFAWTDLKVSPEELELITRMAESEDFTAADREEISRWINVPPPVDPTQVPPEHRQVFLDAVRAVIEADGKVVPAESDSYRFFQELLSESD